MPKDMTRSRAKQHHHSFFIVKILWLTEDLEEVDLSLCPISAYFIEMESQDELHIASVSEL